MCYKNTYRIARLITKNYDYNIQGIQLVKQFLHCFDMFVERKKAIMSQMWNSALGLLGDLIWTSGPS